MQKFVEALYTKFDKFLQPPRHPKWRDVNLAATVPGWTRWGVADDMLRKLRQEDPASEAQADSRQFGEFLKIKAVTVDSPQQRDALFREFLLWEQKQRADTSARDNQ